VRYIATKKKKLVTTIVTISLVIIGTIALAANEKKLPNFATKLVACDSFPNNSIQKLVETTRLKINLPRHIYLHQQSSSLVFKTVVGNAHSHWISNAGPIGNAVGSTKECSVYYYEFDGTGEVDLSLKSSNNGTPNYFVRFIVRSNVIAQPNVYRNDQYRFTFKLPDSWKGYSVLAQTWSGYASSISNGQAIIERGPQIILRNPNWTIEKMRQDIPIMVFTLRQWSALKGQKFYVSAAPIAPSELGRNSQYLFALPPRYNYIFPTGWQEVEKILEGKPLLVF
jgi:hypothetical protein